MVGGGRALVAGSPAAAALVAFIRSVFQAGGSLSVGCASGADQAALSLFSSLAPSRVSVFAAFSPSGAGSWRCSAVSAVRAAAAAGASVRWLAGGSLAVPLVARLALRSRAALAGCAAAVFFLPGRGSLSVARAALQAGIPVLVSCAGLAAAPVLPVPAVRVVVAGLPFWSFAPAVQAALF